MREEETNNLTDESVASLQQQISEWEKKYNELDRFSYTVTHDLKAPLRAINNLSKWIEEDLGEKASDEVIGNLKMMRSRVCRMKNLINGILQYSKAGKISEEKENVNVGELLSEIVEMLAPPKEFIIDIQNDMPAIAMEKIALQQVFQNLLSNGIKFHPHTNGKIAVTFREMEKFYEFSVSDNGMGIEPEFHERVFEPFQSLQSKDKIEGTGIGLAIVKKIVESRGGNIKLISEKDKGAKFIFTLLR